MAALFQRDKSFISRHIPNIFDEGELRPEATVAESATVQTEGELRRESVVADSATTPADGKTYQVEHFSLDVIISVG